MKHDELQFDIRVTSKGVNGKWPIKDLWNYRDLILLFVRRNFVLNYKQTILGPVWAFINPLLTTVVFTVVFGKLAKLPTDGVPPFLFYMCGNIAWSFFSNALTTVSGTLQNNVHLMSKVHFPRLVIPISNVLSKLITYAIQMLFFLCFLLYFHFRNGIPLCTLQILMLPVLLLQMSFLALGIGLFFATITIRYRDLSMLVGFGMHLWMYATPIAYSVSLVPSKYHLLYACNPMVSIIDFYRGMFFGSTSCSWEQWSASLVCSLIIFLAGIWCFNRTEKDFIDTI